MNKFLAITLTGFIFFGIESFAHEGHSDAPGQLKALHGGVVTAGKEMNMEMLFSNDTVQLFPLAHSGEDLGIADVKLSGTAKIPKGKPAPLSFVNDGKGFSSKVDLKGSYRADLEVKATYKGKTDTFKFLVEK